MIAERRISHNDKRKVAKELKEQGFISKTAISRMSYKDAIELIGSKAYNYTSKQLENIFKTTPQLRAIKLDVSDSISYWYFIEDLRKLSGKQTQAGQSKNANSEASHMKELQEYISNLLSDSFRGWSDDSIRGYRTALISIREKIKSFGYKD